MKTATFKCVWPSARRMHSVVRASLFLTLLAILLLSTSHLSATSVNWLSGGPNTGYPSGIGNVDGDITLFAEYHTPCGLVMDITGNYLYVADRDNNAVRILDFGNNWTYHLVPQDAVGNPLTNIFSRPVGVMLDKYGNLFVLNRGNNTNGTVLEISFNGILIATNLTKITNAAGIAQDSSGNIFVTASNRVIKVNTAGVSNVVATISGASLQGIVVKHSSGLLAVCDSAQNGIYLINPTNGVVTTNAGFHGAGDFYYANNIASSNSAKFFQPAGIAEAGDGTLIVADNGNHRVKAVLASGVVTNIYGVTSGDWISPYPGFLDGTVKVPDQTGGVAARLPNGVTIASDGTLYVTEDYYHIIRHVTGAGLTPPPPPPPQAPATLNATAGYGQVILSWSASSGATSYNIKRSTFSGGEATIATATGTTYTDTNVVDNTTYYYVVSSVNTTGEGQNSAEVSAVPQYSPPPANLSIASTNFGVINLTWSMSPGATSYNLKRSISTNGLVTIASTTATSYSDTSVSSGTTYYYVVSAVNAGGENPITSAEVSATAPIPPPAAPIIGWFDYEGNDQTGFFTVIHSVSGANFFTANNDILIAIDPATNGLATYYIATNGPQPVTVVPSVLNGTTPPFYQDGLSYAQPLPVTTMPDLVIKAVSVGPGGNSPISTAEFLFQVGNPTIGGFNGAQFTVSDITSNAVFWYTLDGTDPTNAAPSIGPVVITDPTTNAVTLSLNLTSNTLFKVRGFRSGYQPSGIAQQSFSISNFVANTISFGFASGEASSDFVASPGQTFYAPVTLSVLPNTTILSLQFNLSVTNAGPNPGPAVVPGAYNFTSFLEEPIPNITPVVYEIIPPLMFYPYFLINPPPVSQVVLFDGPNGVTNFVNMVTANTSDNLLSVGWLERSGQKNLYDTTKQTLITYSEAHDVIYSPASGQVEVGGFSFQVPVNATNGQTYQIQIGRPSATSDGIGAPGSDVFIIAPTNGSFAGGSPINAVKYVTVGQRKYTVGSVYPFRWFNAGDFGSSNIANADVSQVFESAIYNFDYPPYDSGSWNGSGYTNVSDFYDAMDSCGSYLAYLDTDTGYYTNDTSSVGHSNALFDGNDTSINQLAYGDGVLDVCDVYVTFRRSLDPSLTWFERYWNNGQRVADTGIPNVANHAVAANTTVTSKTKSPVATVSPQVNFAAGDIQGSAGKVVSIPINATIFGNYPLRVLMLNLTVAPLDGSPALTTPVQFTQNASVLGAPYITDSKGNGNYSAVWLNSTNAGLTGTVTIGTLTMTIPSGASSNAAYAVHFDHASASPNGIASFPKQTLTGLITLSSRTNSTYRDGIPDSWRLRWFGTVNNLLSISNASPTGDGISNWKKYIAGVDPTVANDFPSVNPKTPVPSGSAAAIHWPTVSGKQYAILSSASLFPGSWITNAIVTGTGADNEWDDTSANGKGKFYRVLILP